MTAATSSSFGTIKLAGDLAGSTDANAPELTASGAAAGTYTNPTLVTNAKGIVTSIMNGSAVDIFAVPNATTGQRGAVTIGAGLTAAAGVVSVATATTSTLGVVSVGTGLNVSSGFVSVNTTLYPTIATGAQFSGAIATLPSVASISGTYAMDLLLSNVYLFTLTGNTTFSLPTNLFAGGTYYVYLKQDATGSRTATFASNFKFESGSSNTLTTTANATDMLRIVAVSTTELVCRLYKNFV